MLILEELLKPETQKFIREHTGDITKLAFAGSPFPSIPIQALLEQISSRNQVKNKLPTWYQTPNIYYPPKLNLEQTSSEITAQHKANYAKVERIIDLTGGFGVDCFYFSKYANSVIHFEKNESLSQIVAHNFKQFGIENIQYKTGDSIELLTGYHDIIYADPGRRDKDKNKVFLLKDCLPNIPKNLDKIWQHTDRLLLKTSPMLDISQGVSELKNVECIHIIAVDNDVKELLWFLKSGVYLENPKILTFNYAKKEVQFFELEEKEDTFINFSSPLAYLYEPNAAIFKSGGFNEVAIQFSLNKLSTHSHLYTSNKQIDFPGRVFKIISTFEYNKQTMKALKNTKANINIRNFRESVAKIRKKWKIKDGGEKYLFFTQSQNNKSIVIECEAVRHISKNLTASLLTT